MNSSNQVGLLLECKPSPYSRAMRTQLIAQAGSFGFDIKVMEVDWPAHPDLIREDDVDGTLATCAPLGAVIVLGGVFSHRAGVLSRFAQHWAPRPLVSIGYRLPGMPSVVVDNKGGQLAATLHLIETHGRRRLLYIRGRRDSVEAEDRYLGYRRALHEKGILYDANLVVEGEFNSERAVRAVTGLSQKIQYDGIVAANDDMALALIGELTKRKVSIPQELSVIGFDDVAEAKTGPIHLATMAQPFETLAREALLSVRRQFHGESRQQQVSVAVRMIPRQSCGC